MVKKSKKSVTKKAAKSGSTKTGLPKDVTEEPRTPEEMHLKHIRQWPNAVKVYLDVSDDKGEVLGSKVLDRRITKFCDLYLNSNAEIKDISEIKDLAKAIEETTGMATEYILQTNMVESRYSGIANKYRIRGGMVFIILQRMVKATKGPKWIVFFKANFDGREFRSVQDYMRLAKIPGIIKYAVFGKERLLQILRQLSEADWKERQNDAGKKEIDPVGAFIARKGVSFNPTQEVDAQELRIETDIAINHEKLLGAGITEITKELVDVLVRNGREIESAHVRELKIAKDAGRTKRQIIKRFKEFVASDGRPEPLMTPERKAEGFKKKTKQFIKTMESAKTDAEYRGQANVELINSIMEMLQQLDEALQTTT